MNDLRVLHDGWSLVNAPLSPQAIHLQAVLAYTSNPVEAVVALPQEPPPWLQDIQTYTHRTSQTRRGRLQWEQLTLPRLARKLGAKLLHLTAPSAPLFGDLATLVSPCGYGGQLTLSRTSEDCRGFAGRVRYSLARGGMSRINGLLWPDDLHHLRPAPQVIALPPYIPPGFNPKDEMDSKNQESLSKQLAGCELPETFILYHGPGDQEHLRQLIEGWRWAAQAVSDYYPLVVVGLSAASQEFFMQLAKRNDLEDSVCVLSEISPKELPEVYHRSSAVFHPAPASPWSGAVRLAIATGRPLIATETDFTDAIVGPAAYLAAQGDWRALGAALVTAVVEQDVAEQLEKKSLQRSIRWRQTDFAKDLLKIYGSVISNCPDD